MDEDVEDSRAGGSRSPDFGICLQGGGSSDPTVRRGVLGDVPSDWEDSGPVPPQGGPAAGKVNPKRNEDFRWIYKPLDKAMKSVGLEEVETYVLCHQNTVAQYIATLPILELCLAG